MNIIEELWYGNISQCERDFKKGSKRNIHRRSNLYCCGEHPVFSKTIQKIIKND